jgi:hypothetical protein
MKTEAPANIIVCPSCKAENIEGTEECQKCGSDLRSIDVPETARPMPHHIFLTPIEQFVHWGSDSDVDPDVLIAINGGDTTDKRTRTAGAEILDTSADIGSALFRMSHEMTTYTPVHSEAGETGYVCAIELLDWLRRECPEDQAFSQPLTMLTGPLRERVGDGPRLGPMATIGDAVEVLANDLRVKEVDIPWGNEQWRTVNTTELLVAYAELHPETALDLAPDPKQLIPKQDGG